MAEERRVDMVRLVGEERYYDREELLGRDASSVFPSLARQQQEEEAGFGGLSADAIKEALGARKFISESELETIRATRGATADDGAVAVDKPLAEILRERKAAKEAEHADKWKQMKIGKNRPLDAEELQFLDAVAEAEAARERAWSEMERAELEAFKAAVRERSAEPEARPGPGPLPGPAGPTPPPATTTTAKADPRVPSVVAAAASAPAAVKPPLKPLLVKVKPKAAAPAARDTATRDTAAAGTGPGAGAEPPPPPAKKAKTAEGGEEAAGAKAEASKAKGAAAGEGPKAPSGADAAAAGQSAAGGGARGNALAALVGEYGSDSDAVSDS